MEFKITECPIFLPNPGDRIRIVVRYQGSWKPIFWFKLAKDGSLYLGPRLTKISELKKAKAQPLGDNQFRMQFSDGEQIYDPELMRKAKLSFHASGIVNTPDGRKTGEVIRSLKEQMLLCMAMFRHPSHFDSVDGNQITNRDVCLNCPIDENRPLWGQIWIAPANKEYPVILNPINWQLNSIFCYKDLLGVQDLTLQFILAYGAEGPWPQYNCLVFAEINAA